MEKNAGYKWLIDQLAELSCGDVSVSRIEMNGHPFHPTLKSQKRDAFLSLSTEQKAMISDLLRETRSAAFHDVASFLEGALANEQLKVDALDQPVDESPFGGFCLDLVARSDGENWPDQD